MAVTVVDHPLVQHKLSILRDEQTHVREFRSLCMELTMLMAFEAMRDLPLEDAKRWLTSLTGVGPKTAQRMALNMLERDRNVARHLAHALEAAMDGVGYCQRCRMLSETEICSLCSDPRRDESLLCILQSPADVWAIEQAGGFNGRYFVLKGHLSPIDGQGPEEIGIPALLGAMEGREALRLDDLVRRVEENGVREVILATNPTVEGEATAHYIANILKPRGIRVSRLAHGIPLGGELEFIDGGTLAHALAGRTPVA